MAGYKMALSDTIYIFSRDNFLYSLIFVFREAGEDWMSLPVGNSLRLRMI
jgi:hypothetical protein